MLMMPAGLVSGQKSKIKTEGDNAASTEALLPASCTESCHPNMIGCVFQYGEVMTNQDILFTQCASVVAGLTAAADLLQPDPDSSKNAFRKVIIPSNDFHRCLIAADASDSCQSCYKDLRRADRKLFKVMRNEQRLCCMTIFGDKRGCDKAMLDP